MQPHFLTSPPLPLGRFEAKKLIARGVMAFLSPTASGLLIAVGNGKITGIIRPNDKCRGDETGAEMAHLRSVFMPAPLHSFSQIVCTERAITAGQK